MLESLNKPARLFILMIVFALTACGEKPVNSDSTNNKTQADAKDEFVGCYTINKDTPAQIKISKNQDGYVMQMKEPRGAKTLWDNPESLKKVEPEQAWNFFRVNALDFGKDDVQAVIMRPDNMMVLTKVKDASKNVNPKLDSDFVVHIFGAVNTIYAVDCDDKQIDIVKTER